MNPTATKTKRRLRGCLQLCFFGLGISRIDAFRTISPPSAARRRSRRPRCGGSATARRPREALATSASNDGREGVRSPGGYRRSASLFGAAPETDGVPDSAETRRDDASSMIDEATDVNQDTNEKMDDATSVLRESQYGETTPIGNEKFVNVESHNDASDEEKIDEDAEPNNEANDPICRVVATSDGKIPPLASSSLSASSKSLLEKLELLFSARSQKELRDLAYTAPRSADDDDDEARRDELAFDAMGDAKGDADGMPREADGIEQEEKLVSILKRSLEEGGFRLMDQRDLDLCSALNAGYLLRLSLLPDNKGLDPCIGREFYPELYRGDEKSKGDDGGGGGSRRGNEGVNFDSGLLFDGRALVFRRGYSKETSTGRLYLPKLDYLQASLVQRSSAAVTRKLGALEQWLENFVLNAISQLNAAVEGAYLRLLQQFRNLAVSIVESFGLSKNNLATGIMSRKAADLNGTSSEIGDGENKTPSSPTTINRRGNRIFKLSRYLTSTSAVIPGALDLNDALTPFLLCEMGSVNSASAAERDIYDGMERGDATCQYDDNLFSIARTDPSPNGSSVKPAAFRLLERVSIQNTVDFFSKQGRRDLIRNYFRSSTLVEPAYEEVIVIWRPLRKKKPRKIQFPPKWLYEVAQVFDMEDRLPEREDDARDDDAFDDGPTPLEIRAFYDVPMANIEAVLPKTKLIFRPADAIVFDLVSVVGFLAIAGSLKFDSPRLDLIALVSLTFFAVRTFFRYSNKYARYDLLVNKFLTSKLAHRGPGALKYIVSEGSSNKALRAMLIRDWLSKGGIAEGVNPRQSDLERGKSYVNGMSSVDASQIDVDIAAALDDLKRLELIDQYEVKDYREALDSVKRLWNDTF